MFETLLESSRRRPRGIGGGVGAVTAHAALAVVAMMTVNREARLRVGPPTDPVPVYIQGGGVAGPVTTRIGVIASGPAAPTLRGELVPAVIPSVSVDVSDVTALGDSRAAAQTLARLGLRAGPGSEPGWGSDEVRLAGEVDEPVAVLVPRRPVYPHAMEIAGIPGRVSLEFIVDTLGRCEPASLRVRESSDPTFEPAAKEAVLGTVFRAARVRGSRVRQLVRQSVVFTVAP